MADTAVLDKIEALCTHLGCECRRDEPMRLHTSFRIGGPADLFLIPESAADLSRLLPAVHALDVPLHVIGRGSNLLVRDEGIRGVVIALTGKFSHMRREGDSILCEAGAPLEALCRFALDEGFSGLEFAHGIPGSVGGAVYMNAGAYGGEMKDVLIYVEHLEADGTPGRLEGEALALSYRRSAYSGGSACILRAAVRLTPGDPYNIRERMEDYLRRRREKQPLEYPSAGSMFKRPEGNYASALIDQCGLKGMRIGDAMVSEKHAGFLINAGNATCADMLALIERVQDVVLEKTGYRLEREVELL